MNRLTVVFVILAALLTLSACGQSSEEPAPDAPEVSPTQAAAQPESAELPPPAVSISKDTEEGSQEAGTPQEAEMPAGATDSAEAEAAPEMPANAAIHPWPPDRFGYGVQSHATIGDPKYTMDVIANQLQMDWIKVQFLWPLVEPSQGAEDWFHYDGVVNDANEQGLNVMFSVVSAPAWSRATGDEDGPPDDFNLYAEFVAKLAERYKGKVHAIEVWNEQNLDREWTTPAGMVPAAYVDFLSRAYLAIKAVDPDIIVISGALSPTGPGDWIQWADDFEYMQQALDAGMLDFSDCIGAHHNGYNIPPHIGFDETGSFAEVDTAIFRGPYDNPNHLWSFKTTLDGYAEMAQKFDPDAKLCVTEFGWASSEGYDEYPAGFEFAQDNTLEEQGEYIVQAFNQMRDSGDVWLAFLFNFDFGNKGGGPTDDPVPYSIVDQNGAPRPAFGAVAGMEKRP